MKGNQEFCTGHVKLKMKNGHPSGNLKDKWIYEFRIQGAL